MALTTVHLNLPVSPSTRLVSTPLIPKLPLLHLKPPRVRRRSSLWLTVSNPKAVEESQEGATESEEEAKAEVEKEELSEIGKEIKKAMEERKERGGDLMSGVAEEIREIEWPAFVKVLGTTGVVLGVIAGSSVVLLTVNVVLAELSDRIFSGRGVQDFFS